MFDLILHPEKQNVNFRQGASILTSMRVDERECVYRPLIQCKLKKTTRIVATDRITDGMVGNPALFYEKCQNIFWKKRVLNPVEE